MATTRPFARYTGIGTPYGTLRYGDILVGVDMSLPYNATYSGVKWWSGADEDQGYIIAQSVSGETQPSPNGSIGSVGFFATNGFDDSQFVFLTKQVTGYNATSAQDAKTWLELNGYWTSWEIPGNLRMFISGTSISGTSLDDLSTFNNDSYMSGTFSLRTFNDTQIISLNGTNGFVQSPGFGSYLDNGFTFDTWVTSGTTSNGTLIAEWNGPAPTGWCDAQSAFVSGNINVGVYSGGLIYGPTFSVNNWYNIVTTYNGNTLKLYVNGQLIGSQSVVKANSGATQLTLGRDDEAHSYLGGATGYLKGLIGQWKIYDYALNESLVYSNYLTYSAIYDNSLVVNLDASKTLSYSGSGTTWTDLSLKGNNGTITNATYSATASGSFYFDGSGDYVLINQPIPSNSNYSISAWVYANNVSQSHNIVSSQDSPFWVASGTLYAGVGTNYTAVSSPSFPTGVWRFVSMTFNDSTNTMKLYINGVLVNTNTNVTQSYTAQNTYIGSHYFGGNPVSFWNGYISQVNIYKSELSSTQILYTFNQTKSRFGL